MLVTPHHPVGTTTFGTKPPCCTRSIKTLWMLIAVGSSVVVGIIMYLPLPVDCVSSTGTWSTKELRQQQQQQRQRRQQQRQANLFRNVDGSTTEAASCSLLSATDVQTCMHAIDTDASIINPPTDDVSISSHVVVVDSETHGIHCVWCRLSKHVGFCVSEEQARSIEHFAAGYNYFLECHRFNRDTVWEDTAPEDDEFNWGDDEFDYDDDDDKEHGLWDDIVDDDADQWGGGGGGGSGDDMPIPSTTDDDFSKLDDQVAPTDDGWFNDDAKSQDDAIPVDDTVVPDDDNGPEPAVDDQIAPPDDDTTPKDDDAPNPPPPPPPDDDDKAGPDNFWSCLDLKDTKTCQSSALNCTWCDTKAGYGLCMTGPAAESAAQSDWFHCVQEQQPSQLQNDGTTESWIWNEALEQELLQDETVDLSCIQAMWEEQTEGECVTTIDQQGQPCQWCSVDSMNNICLTVEQAQIGQEFGIACNNLVLIDSQYDNLDGAAEVEQDDEQDLLDNPMDGSSPAAVSFQTQHTRTDNKDHAYASARIVALHNDPYDTSCLMNYFQDPSSERCHASIDASGQPCQLCSIQIGEGSSSSSLSLCLTNEQAELGEQFGLLTCGSDSSSLVANQNTDPHEAYAVESSLVDPTCLGAVMTRQDHPLQLRRSQKDVVATATATATQCVASTDRTSDHSCQWCYMEDEDNVSWMGVCLTWAQGEMATTHLGLVCTDQNTVDRLATSRRLRSRK